MRPIKQTRPAVFTLLEWLASLPIINMDKIKYLDINKIHISPLKWFEPQGNDVNIKPDILVKLFVSSQYVV